MKILVVEDDTLIREGLSEFLSESGYSIIQAKDSNNEAKSLIRYSFGDIGYSNSIYQWIGCIKRNS